MRRIALLTGFFTASLCIFFIATNVYAEKDISGLCLRAGLSGSELEKIQGAYLGAVNSGINEEDLYLFFEAILNHGLNCSQLVAVLNRSTQLKRGGLPFWPLFSKVREGIAKGAPPGKIVQVVDEKTGTLGRAGKVVGSLEAERYTVKDYDGAVILIASYIEKGYTGEEILHRISKKGLESSGFAGITKVLARESN